MSIYIDTTRMWRDRWVRLQGIDLEVLSLEEHLEDVPPMTEMNKFEEMIYGEPEKRVGEQVGSYRLTRWLGRDE